MLKPLLFIVTAICGLSAAYQPNHDKRGEVSNYQTHFKTPLGVNWQGPVINISKKVLSADKVPFIEHPAGNASWLGMNFDYHYVKPVFELLNSTKVPLINRGESHVTVISPPEFAVLATAGITIEQVNKIARDLKIQSSKVTIVCLGKEDVVVADLNKIVYQVIVKVPNLVKIRQKIFQLYIQRGGNSALFDPQSFWPHITVGFTSGDVFLEQGVYKGYNVCYRPISIKK
ncbi:hypothetical protein HPULCUR_007947 [Helicostylum pulchrum]|uniref:Swiss Army Knife 2H phosphoesterase domain-containing protein n=1 Tax=Helicostylum pulchrum TaxID=562976 RepID=A0ABP9Y690_9FUNG